MRSVNIHEAKTQLSRLVAEAANGEPFIIAKAGRPMVKVVPLDEHVATTPRRRGFLPHLPPPPADFDDMYAEEIAALFNGDE